ncbi:transmembrane protein 106B-like isoform X2 [Montipora foliosa]|uniref:transmembrane protein 106B-like isoform X2 n=1 Tax=Montipora foliosa TaxID=591990 RepID=UPI0035F11EE4
MPRRFKSRWFRKNRSEEMLNNDEKNILSDPTSDSNVQGDNFGATASNQAPGHLYSSGYEEFDRRPILSKNGSDASLSQTCPTCGGTGKLTKEQEHDLVALIPVRDRRLKPRRMVLYLAVAIFICVTISVIAGVFLFPRSISLELGKTVPVSISMPSSNTTKPFILINTTVTINNSNFFEASLDGFSFEVNWQNYVVAQRDFKQTVKQSFIIKTVYGDANQEAKKIRRICCGWSFNLAFLITVSAKTHSLTVSSEASDNQLKYVNCDPQGLDRWKSCD